MKYFRPQLPIQHSHIHASWLRSRHHGVRIVHCSPEFI